jgi:hypothetical protein
LVIPVEWESVVAAELPSIICEKKNNDMGRRRSCTHRTVVADGSLGQTTMRNDPLAHRVDHKAHEVSCIVFIIIFPLRSVAAWNEEGEGKAIIVVD